MPSKSIKDNKEDTKSKVKTNKKVEVESDDEVETKKTKSKTKKVEEESDEEVETKKTKSKTKKVEEDSDEEVETKSKGKKTTQKIIEVDEEDEEEIEEEEEEEDDEDVEDDEQECGEEAKRKEKKQKESFEELTNKMTTLQNDKKNIDKEISDLEKKLKSKEKERNDIERQTNSILKLLSKSHSDEINKARKEKPKRKGNVNGGFNKEQPVPEILCKFLGFPEGTAMARPKVMSQLNNKFSNLGLKSGQNTTLDKPTAKALGLGKEGEGKTIKFTEFQSFLASFYPKKEEKEVEL
jgi:myosin heavy subunit